jgi:hypothetical protein
MALDPTLSKAFREFAIHIQDLMINPDYADEIIGNVFDAYTQAQGETGWTRNGTTLTPAVEGDDVDIKTGRLMGGGIDPDSQLAVPMRFVSNASSGTYAHGSVTLAGMLTAGDEFTITVSGTPYTVVAGSGNFDIVPSSFAEMNIGISASNLDPGDSIQIFVPDHGDYTLVAGTDFVIGPDANTTMANLGAAINNKAGLRDYVEFIGSD